MKTIVFAAIGLTALALSGCVSRYDSGYYDRSGYYHGYRDHYADRDYRYDHAYRYDRDNDGVPNYADRRPYDPDRY